jgi:hypothetical protein
MRYVPNLTNERLAQYSIGARHTLRVSAYTTNRGEQSE